MFVSVSAASFCRGYVPCHPMEYGNETSNRLSYLVSRRFIMSARPGEKGDEVFVGVFRDWQRTPP